jgi:hypothetical protein
VVAISLLVVAQACTIFAKIKLDEREPWDIEACQYIINFVA